MQRDIDQNSCNMVYQGKMLVFFKERATVSADTTKSILLKYEIKHNKINILVNREQRPDTCILGSQGDHVTAYTVLLQTICNLIDGEEVHDAPNILYNAVNCFFEQDNINKLEFESFRDGKTIDFKSKLLEVKSKFFSKEIRKNLAKYLKTIRDADINIKDISNLEVQEALNFIQSNNKIGKKKLKINRLVNCIKRGNQCMFAQLIVDVGEQILKKYNKKSTAAFPKLLEDGEDNTGEGSRVKNAMLHLRVLNKFLKLKANSISEQQISEFKINCSNIIKSSVPQIQDEQGVNTKFNKIFLKLFNVNFKINLTNIDEHINKIDINKCINTIEIGKLFNDLFDFKQNRIRQAIMGIEQEGKIVDNGTKIALNNPLACLYEVVARHVKFMFVAFNWLNILSTELKNKIIDGFYDKVIASPINELDNNQGWGKLVTTEALTQGVINYNNKNTIKKLKLFI